MDTNKLQDIENYYLGRAEELIEYSKRGDTWFFVGASTFMNHLANLIFGNRAGRIEYVKFVINFMPSDYKDFIYLNGIQDLPLQMWCVLRCGIIHSFSLIADRIYEPCKSQARDRSIMFAHDKNKPVSHLKNYKGIDGKKDVALFVAENFAGDIVKTVKYIFNKAKNNTQLENNIINWIKQFPPIMTEGLLK